MFGVHQAEETAIFYKVPPKHRMVDEVAPAPTTTYSTLSLAELPSLCFFVFGAMVIRKRYLAPGPLLSTACYR